MNITILFDGDDDDPTKNVQHDVHRRALRLIVAGCCSHVRTAEAILKTEAPWVTTFIHVELFDHRLIQMPHDLLAAVWRFRTGRIHPGLPFEEPDSWRTTTEGAWLDWLRNEIDRWGNFHPCLIRATAQTLAIEMPEWYEADSLSLQLLNIYSDVPWTADLRQAFHQPQ